MLNRKWGEGKVKEDKMDKLWHVKKKNETGKSKKILLLEPRERKTVSIKEIGNCESEIVL